MRSRATIGSMMVAGAEAVPVSVEVVVTEGMPGTRIVGMTDDAAFEASSRVRAAVLASGFSYPSKGVLVNVSPVALRKAGSVFDLAIAVGILVATGQVPRAHAARAFAGELALDGAVRPVRGSACFAAAARERGIEVVLSADTPDVDSGEWGGCAVGVESLADLASGEFAQLRRKAQGGAKALDFADMNGYATAKRACQVAAAGKLGLLLVGQEGAGKTMLAARMPSILPDMDDATARECSRIYSAAGVELPAANGRRMRPFRSPHHSAFLSRLIGGGNPVLPGEVSLAHGGVLYLADIPEFSPNALQMLRPPLEQGEVSIARADGLTRFPADFLLVASAKPCPCGMFGSEAPCTCAEGLIKRYRSRLCGPLHGLIPMSVDVRNDIMCSEQTSASDVLRDGVARAWEFRAWREGKGDTGESAAAALRSCRLSDADAALFRQMTVRTAWPAREVAAALAIARAIADIEESESVTRDHLLEAAGFRNRAS